MADEEAHQETRCDILDVVQSMIDISADRLEGLRTQCATSAELTQQEIRTLEGKLIKLFARQLMTKAKLQDDILPSERKHVPSLEQWLQVVGLSAESIQGVCQRVGTLEALQERSEHELRNILSERNAREEEVRRLNRALHNLKKYTEILLRDETPSEAGELALYWDSWDHHQVMKNAGSTSPRPPRNRAERSSVPSEDCLPYNNNNYNNCNNLGGSISTLAAASSTSSIISLPHSSTPTHQGHAPLSPPIHPCTPPSTPPVGKGKGGDRGKFPTTPPPCKKHLTGLQQPADVYPLTKSKSHESQLGNRVEGADNLSNVEHIPRRGRLPTEPGPYCSEIGHTSPLISSPMKSPPYNSVGIDSSDDNSCKSTLQVPKSPRTPTVTRPMCHAINHRFTKTFKMIATCDFCDKQMFIGTGLKCKECKYKCHRDCESKVPPSCGLPRELVDEFRRTLQPDVFLPNQSPSMSRSSPSHHTSNLLANIRKNPKRQHPQPSINIPPFPQGPDSSSNTSSCNSSTPSSPALVMTTHTPHSTTKQQFHFPDVSHKQDGVTLETHPLVASPALEEVIETHKSNDSDRTVSASGSGSISTDSEQTPVRVDSQDSQVSDGEAVDRTWPRQNSLSMREWDIPFDELKIGEPIGTGRFGTVYRGNWHGDVAIRVLNMDYLDDEKTLEAFKLEVATFRKTRHENLVLFMGACMKLPRLAIVTSMCKGMTLYTHIHTCKDKFNMNKTTMVAQQISQGMGYLHARGIVHKDLKSKNIFLENGKVIITDFGLFSVTKLCFGNRKGNTLSIPPGWLCYLSPEIIRSLRVRRKHDEEELPFTKASDVYAFGTVWYELLCGEWPFKAQPPEAIIWQVGKGMKQSLANLQASRDVKDILTLCWSYRPSERPDFACLLKTLEKLPKKRLARSPSHPIHLSRSAESVF
ncbi:Kinase suppressor of Ras 2 [Cryptotermes secundus]|uniref:Kinase suppressor of Ras 2 n=2 Tax=Cryptotermes secundus TaxID=105785 RepID=A0A2J7RE49_9NEOP|nr:kinase suppressor of Ras 1 isoform X1 [Cryptotermes secundus]PNF39107.1 Kinase suppressor of Ras 2 [Cryptotermes secundus]